MILHDFDILYDKKWIEGRNGKVVGRWVLLPSRCKYLTPDNKCELHDKDKPFYCKLWPDKKFAYLEALGCRYFEEDKK